MAEFIEISAKDNPLIKLICSLQSSAKARKENGKFVLEGLRICKDALENGIKFDKLIVSKTAAEKYRDDVEKFSAISEKAYLIPDSLFKKISDTDSPQGIIAVVNTFVSNAKPEQNGKYIALENIQDPSNLGAVARTAEALGISGIILSGGCDVYSPKSLRSSMGTLLRVPLFFAENIIEFCKENNLKTFACVVDKNADDIKSIDFSNGSVIIIGNEANGITDATKSGALKQITIHMNGYAESLNAAAAAAIAMWEMMR